jgi:hypothetical protein
MNKYIVTTTIFPPSKATILYSTMQDWTLVVVGDKKTPHEDYKKINCVYLDPDTQECMYPALSNLLGWNCIQRRNIGYLYALSKGADIIASVDDDNIPMDNWGKEIIVDKNTKATKVTPVTSPYFDPLSFTKYNHLWHRGFPLQFLSVKNTIEKEDSSIVPDVQACLWNGDPDVDAICRLEHSPNCNFENITTFFSDKPSPFNSQNTIFSRKALKDYFLFPGVGRMDDIFGSYLCQSKGHKVAYTEPTVIQDRNNHDLIDDFKKEIIGYVNIFTLDILPEMSIKAFNEYQRIILEDISK